MKFLAYTFKIIADILLLCSIALYFTSLWQPAFGVERGWENGVRIDIWSSAMCLLVGWLGVITMGVGLTWLANPCLAAAWLSVREPRASVIFSVLAVLISASFLLFSKIPVDEGGNMGTICEYYSGYWLWLSSTIAMLASNGIHIIALYMMPKRPRENRENPFVGVY